MTNTTPAPISDKNRLRLMLIIDINRVPSKYLILYSLFPMFLFVAMLMLIAVSLSKATGIPDDFAIDNEQRIYLSVNEGVAVVQDGSYYYLIPPNNGKYTLSVAENDMLTIASITDVRVVDLAASDPVSGQLEVVMRYDETLSAQYELGMQYWKTDQQNGVNYRYEGNLFYYKILREDTNGTSVFYAMPLSDYIWNIVPTVCFALFFVYIGLILFLAFRYAKKHPEIVRKDFKNPFAKSGC